MALVLSKHHLHDSHDYMPGESESLNKFTYLHTLMCTSVISATSVATKVTYDQHICIFFSLTSQNGHEMKLFHFVSCCDSLEV